MKVWIARDGEKNNANDGEVCRFSRKPIWKEKAQIWTANKGEYEYLQIEDYPEIKNGECYEAEIVLKEKV